MNVAVFCGSSMPRDERFQTAAADLGCLLAAAGHTLVYGGSNLGLMGVVSSSAMHEGGRVVAVIPTLFPEEVIQSQQVSQIIRVKSMAERKERIIALCDAFVALPGGIGTLDELFEVAVANQLRRFGPHADCPAKPMLLLNMAGFYNPLLSQLDVMRQANLLHGDTGLHSVGSVAELMNLLR